MTFQLPQIFRDLTDATKAAQAATVDATLGTQVKKGQIQIVRVTFNAKGVSTVTPVSDFLSQTDALAKLREIAVTGKV